MRLMLRGIAYMKDKLRLRLTLRWKGREREESIRIKEYVENMFIKISFISSDSSSSLPFSLFVCLGGW